MITNYARMLTGTTLTLALALACSKGPEQPIPFGAVNPTAPGPLTEIAFSNVPRLPAVVEQNLQRMAIAHAEYGNADGTCTSGRDVPAILIAANVYAAPKIPENLRMENVSASTECEAPLRDVRLKPVDASGTPDARWEVTATKVDTSSSDVMTFFFVVESGIVTPVPQRNGRLDFDERTVAREVGELRSYRLESDQPQSSIRPLDPLKALFSSIDDTEAKLPTSANVVALAGDNVGFGIAEGLVFDANGAFFGVRFTDEVKSPFQALVYPILKPIDATSLKPVSLPLSPK